MARPNVVGLRGWPPQLTTHPQSVSHCITPGRPRKVTVSGFLNQILELGGTLCRLRNRPGWIVASTPATPTPTFTVSFSISRLVRRLVSFVQSRVAFVQSRVARSKRLPIACIKVPSCPASTSTGSAPRYSTSDETFANMEVLPNPLGAVSTLIRSTSRRRSTMYDNRSLTSPRLRAPLRQYAGIPLRCRIRAANRLRHRRCGRPPRPAWLRRSWLCAPEIPG